MTVICFSFAQSGYRKWNDRIRVPHLLSHYNDGGKNTMNAFERTWLERSLTKLEEVLPYQKADLMRQYETDETMWSVEQIEDLVFCLFSFSVTARMKQLVLLVYDDQKRIIADAGACHAWVNAFLEDTEIYDYLSEESDWMYLEHYVLSNTMFPDLPYPFCETKQKTEEQGEVLLFTNAYVSRAFRRRGIFRTMLETMKDHALRNASGIRTVYTVMSMDPDIACYGPDAVDEPYYYSFEQDEPIRLRNAEIARKVCLAPLRLEPNHPEEETDGTKLWFCVGRELCEIIEV